MIQWNDAALSALLISEHGPTGIDLARRAIRVEASAKGNCPVDTGRLRASIAWEINKDSEGLFAIVGTDVEYAPYVEEGTRYMAPQPFLRPALSAA